MPRLLTKICCFCGSLRTGTWIIGILNFVGSVVLIIWNVYWIISTLLGLSRPSSSVGSEETYDEDEDDSGATISLYTWTLIIYSICLAEGIFRLGVNTYLLVGLYTVRREHGGKVKCVRMWFRVGLFLLAFQAGLFIRQLSEANYIEGAVYSGLIVLPNIYCLIVVHSFATQLEFLTTPGSIPPVAVKPLGP